MKLLILTQSFFEKLLLHIVFRVPRVNEKRLEERFREANFF